MAEQKTQVDFVEVKAEDIIGERKALYDWFMTATKVGIGVTVVLLVVIYLFWG